MNNNGATPLFYASAFGQTNAVQSLLNANAKATEVSAKGVTAMHEAALSGDVSILEMLIAAGAPIDVASQEDQWTPLCNAIQFRRDDAVELLLESGADANRVLSGGRTPLMVAALNGTAVSVVSLLQHGADVKAQDNSATSPIHYAAARGDVEILAAVINSGAALNARDGGGATALHLVASTGKADAAALLLRSGANANLGTFTKRYTPLIIAAASGNTAVVSVLLENGAESEAMGSDRATAVQVAAIGGHCDALKRLLNAGANPISVDSKGFTTLHAAIQSGEKVCVAALLEAGMHPDARANGLLPLTFAGIHERLEIMRLLIAKGASFAIRDDDGWAPVHHLTGLGKPSALAVLIEAGADVNVATDDGYSVVGVAESNGRLELLPMLAQAGADITHLDVGLWLEHIGFGELADTFEENEITGEVLTSLTKEIVRDDLGVTKLGRLVLFMKSLAALQASPRHIHDEL